MLSTSQKQIVSKAVSSHLNGDSSTKEFFKFAYELYKGADSSRYGSITKQLNEEIAKNSKATYVHKHFKGINKLAKEYVSIKALTYFDKLSYDSISKVVKLLLWGFKNLDTKEVKEIRETIANSFEEGMSDYRYDNKVQDIVVQLRIKYKLPESYDYTKIVTTVSKMSDEDKLKLIAELQAELQLPQAAA